MAVPMNQPPETTFTASSRVCCDGAGDIRASGAYQPSALGHPRIWLEIDDRGFTDCPYCDQRFVIKGGAADTAKAA